MTSEKPDLMATRKLPRDVRMFEDGPEAKFDCLNVFPIKE